MMARRAVHIVTIEDPIEVLHADKLGMVNQREIRDAETLKNALAVAETGHLVLSPSTPPTPPRRSTAASTCSRPSSSAVLIELGDALGVATNPHDPQVALRSQGLVARPVRLRHLERPLGTMPR